MTVTRLMSSRLFGVAPLDVTTFVIAGVTLVAVAVRIADPGVERGAPILCRLFEVNDMTIPSRTPARDPDGGSRRARDDDQAR